MQPLLRRDIDGGVAMVAHSTRVDGDLSPSAVALDELTRRRQQLVSHPWYAVHQVHSDRVIAIDATSAFDGRPVADALVTKSLGIALAVHSGDCVPIGFVSEGGAVAAAHAGWKGLEAGVLESTVRRLRNLAGDAAIVAAVGPHIRPDHYEFGPADLERLQARFGSDVAARTTSERPALDLTTAVAAELDRLGVEVEYWSDECTARDSDRFWSHRARQEPGRIALVAWLE